MFDDVFYIILYYYKIDRESSCDVRINIIQYSTIYYLLFKLLCPLHTYLIDIFKSWKKTIELKL